MDLQGPDFSDSRDPMIIFAALRDPIFNSRDPNRVPNSGVRRKFSWGVSKCQNFSLH